MYRADMGDDLPAPILALYAICLSGESGVDTLLSVQQTAGGAAVVELCVIDPKTPVDYNRPIIDQNNLTVITEPLVALTLSTFSLANFDIKLKTALKAAPLLTAERLVTFVQRSCYEEILA